MTATPEGRPRTCEVCGFLLSEHVVPCPPATTESRGVFRDETPEGDSISITFGPVEAESEPPPKCAGEIRTDPNVPRDTVEFRDQSGRLQGKIVGLTTPREPSDPAAYYTMPEWNVTQPDTVAPPPGHSLYGMALVHCVCGWSGEVKDLRPDSRACPNCGTTGGLEFGERPAVAPCVACGQVGECWVGCPRNPKFAPATVAPPHEHPKDSPHLVAQDAGVAGAIDFLHRHIEAGESCCENCGRIARARHAAVVSQTAELSRLRAENERLLNTDPTLNEITRLRTENERLLNGEQVKALNNLLDDYAAENAALRAEAENLLTPAEAEEVMPREVDCQQSEVARSAREKCRRIAGSRP